MWNFGLLGQQFLNFKCHLLVPTIRREGYGSSQLLGWDGSDFETRTRVDDKIWVNNAPLKLHHSIHFSCFFFFLLLLFHEDSMFPDFHRQISWQISTIRSHHNDPTVSWLGSWRQGPQSQPLWLRDLVPWCCGSSPTAGWILLFSPCRRWRSCLEDFRILIEIRIRDQNYSLS